jgi:transcriptional regulator with XRE-family HTH domain
MASPKLEKKQSELGDFLRSRRERLSPAALGLPAVRRRTPGLRREEVAARAGIGVDWYVRLEQGRSTSPSLQTVDALARALGLDAVEHAHLRNLAKTEPRQSFSREQVPAGVRRVVESLAQPAYLTGQRWDVLSWNQAAQRIFRFAELAPEDRNILVCVLTLPASRRLFGAEWAREARRLVGLFRTTYDVWAEDPAFVELIVRLRRHCPEFTRWWNAHDVRAPSAGQKVLQHPTLGTLHFEHASFQASEDPRLRVVVLTPV